MSLSQVQMLATQTLFAVESGKNLSDELSKIIVQNPELSVQEKIKHWNIICWLRFIN